MNKFIASIMLGASVAGLQAAYAPGLSTMETSKPWSVSASVRGFYDDNYATTTEKLARDSYGFEVTPSASLNLPLEQSFIGLSYLYSLRYYEDRVNHKADHNHQVNAKLDHAFTERYKLELSESFVIAQEPTIIDPNGAVTVPLRTQGDNLRNTASALFTAQLTQLVGLQLGYANNIYDYEQHGFVGSRSALLDRMEHVPSVNLRWHVLRQTIAVLGYQFELVDFTSNDKLFVFGPISRSPDFRNSRSHKVFIGADQNFNANLNGSIRVGGQFTEYPNQHSDTANPYADASLTYTYMPGSYFQAGITHGRNRTDVVGFTAFDVKNITVDQESTSVYLSLTHRLTPKLTGSILGQFQHSTFNGGMVNNDVDNFFIVGMNLGYAINPHFSAEAGFNHTRLDSDLAFRAYTRNYFYVGIRATY